MGGFVQGAAASVVAAFALIFLLRFFLSPHVEIDSKIRKGKNRNGKPVFRFRVTNKSPRQLINVRFYAHRVRKEGTVSFTKKIAILTEETPCLEAFDPYQSRTDFYNVIGTRYQGGYPKLMDIFDEAPDISIRFRVIATDPYSQVTRVFTRFFSQEDVTEEEFDHRVKEDQSEEAL